MELQVEYLSFLKEMETKTARRPICFHILLIFLFLAFWSCLGVYQHREISEVQLHISTKKYVPLASMQGI